MTFDLVAHLRRQKEFSEKTFGPGERTAGVIDHIRKELFEIEADPTDIMEWVDVIILAFDGAWRAGWEAQAIVDAIVAKQTKNESRDWPDWRTADPNKAIEHVRVTSAPDAYWGNWSDYESMKNDFLGSTGLNWNLDEKEVTSLDPEPDRILAASYRYEDYEGDAFVLFVKDGKLYEVNGSHCSCYGLEGQWSPEEVHIESLEHRIKKSDYGMTHYHGVAFAEYVLRELQEFARKETYQEGSSNAD